MFIRFNCFLFTFKRTMADEGEYVLQDPPMWASAHKKIECSKRFVEEKPVS